MDRQREIEATSRCRWGKLPWQTDVWHSGAETCSRDDTRTARFFPLGATRSSLWQVRLLRDSSEIASAVPSPRRGYETRKGVLGIALQGECEPSQGHAREQLRNNFRSPLAPFGERVG